MFHHIEGTVAELMPYVAVVDCGGVGFEINTTLNTIARLKTGEKAKLYIFDYVKEDAFDLYGFATKSEKRSFELLIGVSGVGPKAAISILSSATPENLAMSIISGDERALTAAPGVGKKIAQRVILELKDKIAKESADFKLPAMDFSASAPGGEDKLSDAAAALSVLGYAPAEINAALRGLELAELKTEEIVRQALKNMMK